MSNFTYKAKRVQKPNLQIVADADFNYGPSLSGEIMLYNFFLKYLFL